MQSRAVILVAGLAILFLVAPSMADDCQLCKDMIGDLNTRIKMSTTAAERKSYLDESCKKFGTPEGIKRCIDTHTDNLPYIESAFFKKRQFDVICKELKQC